MASHNSKQREMNKNYSCVAELSRSVFPKVEAVALYVDMKFSTKHSQFTNDLIIIPIT
jgi:hypothetical protein